jgi:hypothetical protein
LKLRGDNVQHGHEIRVVSIIVHAVANEQESAKARAASCPWNNLERDALHASGVVHRIAHRIVFVLADWMCYEMRHLFGLAPHLSGVYKTFVAATSRVAPSRVDFSGQVRKSQLARSGFQFLEQLIQFRAIYRNVI